MSSQRGRPMRLRIRSYWLPDHRKEDLVIPSKELKEDFKLERHMKLILLRLRWGRREYRLVVNEHDLLELKYMGNTRVWGL